MPPTSSNLVVIVRTCGRELVFLRRALAAIAAQTLRPAQVIVSNDGAESDEIEAVVKSIFSGPNVLVLQRPAAVPPNRSAALNRALAAVNTPWIAFLDDDDTWSSHFLERMVLAAGKIESVGDFGGVVCRTEAVYERYKDGRLEEMGREPFNPHLHRVDTTSLAKNNLFTINAAIWRTDVFSKAGLFREDLAVLEDWEFNMRVTSKCRVVVLRESLAYYHLRIGGGLAPNSSSRDLDRMTRKLQQEWRRSGLMAPEMTDARWFVSRIFSRLRQWRARFGFWLHWGRRK